MKGLRAVAITISDRCARGEQEDISGAALVAALVDAGAETVESVVMADDFKPLVAKLTELASRPEINLIVTTGGTGFGPRDNTPEATRAVLEKDAPGLAEAMRAAAITGNPHAMLSRGICGICSGTLIVNLPGSPAAVKESFAVIKPVLAHAIALIAGNTNH